MRFRQVHLDFHTSEIIKEIGSEFSKEQFQSALKLGCVDSITVFSKCHHGWAYHPSDANEIHPNLNFDLLGAMIDAAHEINVKTPVYLSAGLDEKLARRHPEWLVRDKEDKTTWVKDFFTPGYHRFCFNTPYLDILIEQIKEVTQKYDADGIFLDIVGVVPCYCQYCVGELRENGKDPRDIEDVMTLAEKVYANYTKRVRDAIDSIKPGLNVFHNGGHIRCGRRDLSAMNTHLELESLPTGGWGYDHFPLSARYVQGLNMEFLGMTGKFHESWGEFGGYKHPNALRYEAALSIANGAKCSIGDQLHPSGYMDEATYALIGSAYSEVKQKEQWCDNVKSVADVALLSLEAVTNSHKQEGPSIATGNSNAGAVRMLLEGNYLFDVVDPQSDFNNYKVIILPDYVTIEGDLKDKLLDYLSNNGKILATGFSGLDSQRSQFEIDFGIEYKGINSCQPSYFRPKFELKNLKNAAFVMYSEGQNISLTDAVELGSAENSYFNRDIFSFCSHRHTPCTNKYASPGMSKNKNGIYMAWNVFEEYATKGSLCLKEMFVFALDALLDDKKILTTSLPAQGVVTLMEQKAHNRYINHLLYVAPVKRGQSIEVIEDIIPLYDINVSIKIEKHIKNIYLAPQMKEIPFTEDGDNVSYTVPCLECHQMVILEY